MALIQIKRNLPNAYRFTASDVTTVTLRGPDQEITKTSPTLVQDGSSDRYSCVITPDDHGLWTFTTEDASGNITHEAQFECVRATDSEKALGLQNSYDDLVPFYPASVVDAAGDTAYTQSTGSTHTLASSQKLVIPWDGYVYGLQIFGKSDIASMASMKFFTAYGALATALVRGISDDWHATTPVEGAWGASYEWKTVLFAKPVFARMGDIYGLEMTNSSGGDLVPCRRTSMYAGSSGSNNVYRLTSSLNLSAANNLSTVYSTNHVLEIKPMMLPPAIAIAGHSFWASHGDTGAQSHTQYESSSLGFDADYDIAAMLAQRLGVPCVNISDGGTSIASWVGSGGLLEANAGQCRPAVILFDTTYNDAGATSATNYTDDEYAAMLDRLLAHCDEINAELVLIEGPGSTYAVTNNGTSSEIERYNQIAEEWAGKTGVMYIPLRWRLNRTVAGDSSKYRREWYDGSDAGLSAYGESGTAEHPSLAGRIAAANAIAAAFKNRRYAESKLWYRYRSHPRFTFLL